MAPIAHLVSYWLLLVLIRSYWLLLALYFPKEKNALPVHLLRQVFYGFHRLNDFRWICVDFMDSWGIWCPWLDDGKRWYSDGHFSDVL